MWALKNFATEDFQPNAEFFCQKGCGKYCHEDMPKGVRIREPEDYKQPEIVNGEKIHDTVVIGQGWSGMLALKYQLQEGMSAMAVEGTDRVGGVWNFSEKKNNGVARSTQITSSLSFTESSDLAIHHCNTHFPIWRDILQYLQDYNEFFGLSKHQTMNFTVADVHKEGDLWVVTAQDGRVVKGKHLIVCTGAVTFARGREDFGNFFDKFTGHVMHSGEYKQPGNQFDGKRVLILGGGESSCDIATEISFHSDKLFLSIPNGQWFGSRYNEGGIPFPLEHFSTKMRRWLLPGNDYPYMFELLRKTTEMRAGINGHGQECWRSPFYTYGDSFVNKNTDILRRITMGQVVPKGKLIECLDGNTFLFSDGTKAENIDILILATGYKQKFPFLTNVKDSDFCISKIYKMCLDTADDTLGFCGFVRPTRGSFPSLSESGARLLAYHWTGKIKLPSESERKAIAMQDQQARDEFYKGANKRLRTLVDIFSYNDDVAKVCGVYPDFWKILTTKGFSDWLMCATSPWHSGQYLLNDDRYYEHVMGRYHYFKSGTPVNGIYFFCTLGHVAWIVKYLPTQNPMLWNVLRFAFLALFAVILLKVLF